MIYINISIYYPKYVVSIYTDKHITKFIYINGDSTRLNKLFLQMKLF